MILVGPTITLLRIDEQILVINKTICRHIDSLDTFGRGMASQDILSHLRNFAEHIMLKIYTNGQEISDEYENIQKAINHVKTRGEVRFLRRFHDFLQIVASHYTLDEENSERLMLKYYEYLLKIREFLKTKYALDVLGNLDRFPINTDSNLKEYYEKIAAKVDRHVTLNSGNSSNDRFYIQKIKPFFVNQKTYYEITFSLAHERTSKFDRFIAFTALEISQFYAAKLFIVDDKIEILGRTMPVFIIVNWEVSIRPCEINNFALILGTNINLGSGHAEYRILMQYLTQTGFNLVEFLEFPDAHFQNVKQSIASNARSSSFLSVLEKCRVLIKSDSKGCNILRYLLYHLNNKIIKLQYERNSGNGFLSGLCLKNKCIPFDTMPFNTSLINHNPKLSALFDCIDSTNRKHELFARFIKNNTEIEGQLYTPVKDIMSFENVEALIETYNYALWSGHESRKLKIYKQNIYIREYQEDTLFIISRLKELAQEGVANYSKSVISWLESSDYAIDSDEKKTVLTHMFENSTVALIYGSAGTGKSTLINHISHFFSDKKKLYLANTNPAVDNLKRRVTASNCTFLTITKFLNRKNNVTEYDLLIIDECSTINNKDMRDILKKTTFRLLILVGDIYQIESIRFGNWFSVARSFIPDTSIFELKTPFRSKNKDLLLLWDRVRNMDETILEHIAKKGYSTTLDASIFEFAESDEIILCLNYDGLYGINNINLFLQASNPSLAVHCGIQSYKVNDPILFNESERFVPLIYNNMKGRIVGIEVLENHILFDTELDKVINGMDAAGYDFELLENSSNGNSVIRFRVDKYQTTDEDDDISLASVIPFQVAYAISIHKAQGLEYNSVKIVITDEIDERITHNIFYTAITRARKKLKIYWTPEVEKNVLNNIKPKNNTKDVALLRCQLK
ncbi:MAG: AAA family ATPase [Synergistaceae bacterium]|nr:AAA family ATPase [Synergistaceae bacterium]